MVERIGESLTKSGMQDKQQTAWTAAVTLVLLFLAFENPKGESKNLRQAAGTAAGHAAAGIAAQSRTPGSASEDKSLRLNVEPILVYRFREAD